MNNYIERFKGIAAEIKRHPNLELVEFKLNPPASGVVFQAVEKRLGAPLVQGIQNFYAQANGFKLRWRIKSGLSDDELDRLRNQYDDYWFEWSDDDDIPFAQIHFIPLEECIVQRQWAAFEGRAENQTFDFQEKTYSLNEFGQHLKPFDLFSTYATMAFVLEEKAGNPKVMLLTDYYAEWDNSKLTDFESYLEMLLVTRGICEARKKFYSEYRGHLKPALLTKQEYWKPRHTPKLFRQKKQS
jgi:hypothetical protein